jgi:hypothetical protein
MLFSCPAAEIKQMAEQMKLWEHGKEEHDETLTDRGKTEPRKDRNGSAW